MLTKSAKIFRILLLADSGCLEGSDDGAPLGFDDPTLCVIVSQSPAVSPGRPVVGPREICYKITRQRFVDGVEDDPVADAISPPAQGA